MAGEETGKKQGWASWGKGLIKSVSKGVLGESDLEVVNPDGEEGELEPVKNEAERKDLFNQLRQYVGSDVMSLLSIPVWLMEPFSTLQKMAELTEFMHLLNEADKEQDPHVRSALIAAFATGAYVGIKRTYKPFNPVLGETFELALGDGTTYLAEQVSHHPPVAAAHAENDHFIYDIVSAPKTKFMGNSIDVFPYGSTRITLKSSGDVYALVPPICRANNLIVGRTWVDTFGDLLVVNLTKGEYCALHFSQCGWFGAKRYKVEGTVYSPDGEPKLAVAGKWNEYMSHMACDAEGAPVKGAAETQMWKAKPLVKDNPYGFTEYAKHMSSMASAPNKGAGLLPTDCRIRPDLVALAAADNATASAAKHELEDKQRAEKAKRKAEGGEWTPRWFKAGPKLTDADMYEDVKEMEEEVGQWVYTGAYAEHAKTVKADAPVPTQYSPWQYE